jgi:hypothetical protein
MRQAGLELLSGAQGMRHWTGGDSCGSDRCSGGRKLCMQAPQAAVGDTHSELNPTRSNALLQMLDASSSGMLALPTSSRMVAANVVPLLCQT